MTPRGSATDFNTSLSQWGSALSAADAEALERAKLSLDADVPLPKPVKPRPSPFDLWAKGRVESLNEDGAKRVGAATTYVGADYRASRDFLFGGMVQLDESRQSIVAAPEAADGKAFLAGPYMAYRLTPHVTLDAKAGWGGADDSAMAQTGTARFATERMQSEAKLSGNWGYRQWQFS
jgi:Autotransporter beta-domain